MMHVKIDLNDKGIVMKKIVILISAVFMQNTLLYAERYADMSIIDSSSVGQTKANAMLEQKYTKKLNDLRHEITMLKTAIMLKNSAVHTMRLAEIEKRFHALNHEIQEKELLPTFSLRFAQEFAGVEREIFDTRILVGKPENMMDIVE